MTDQPQIFPVVNPVAWTLPEYQILVALAFQRNAPVSPHTALHELEARTGMSGMSVLVGRDDGSKALTAMSVCFYPSSAFFPRAALYHFFCKGSDALRKALVDAIIAKTTDMGYNEIETANVNGKDAAFERLFRDVGLATRVGSLYRFDLG